MNCIRQFALHELGTEISIGSLEMQFECPRISLKKALRTGLGPPKLRARHSTLPDDSEAEADILAWTRYEAEKSQLSTRTEQRSSIIVPVNSARHHSPVS
jgi:hypothetical protein